MSERASVSAGVCAFSLGLSVTWRDVVLSADTPLAGLVWFVLGVVRRDVLVASAGRDEWLRSLVLDAPSAEAEDEEPR
jgi:hypothetical protein